MTALLTHFALFILLCITCFEAWGEPSGNIIEQAKNTAITEGWNLKNDSDGIYVYSRSSHNSDIHEVLVITKILAPSWRVNAVLADYQHHPEFMPYVSETVPLKNEPPRVWVFQQLDFFPLPVRDRYYTIRIVTETGRFGAGSYRIGWNLENEKSLSKEGRGIPIPINAGFWELRPINNDAHTAVIYYHLADPGSWLPAWAINKATIKVLPMMIKAVKQQVSAPQYDKFIPCK
jgi:hypothetical protein